MGQELETYLEKHSYQQVIDAILALQNQQETVTTSDIRGYLDWDDVNKVKYRLRKLEDFGLVMLEDRGTQNARPLPLAVSITHEGMEIINEYEWENREAEGKTKDERIEELEQEVRELREELHEQQYQIDQLRGFMKKVENMGLLKKKHPDEY